MHREVDALTLRALETALEGRWEAACREWHPVVVERRAFAVEIARRIDLEEDHPRQIERLATSDIFLVAACTRGDADAWSAFERHHLSGLEQRIARSRSVLGTDVYDRVREDLLGPARSALLQSYKGRSRLSAWLYGIARRKGQESAREDRRFVAVPDDTQEAHARDPELEFLHEHFSVELKGAIEEALASLSQGDRKLLGKSLLDRQSIDTLGKALGTHRATAARRLVKLREDLKERVYGQLGARLGLSREECLALRGTVDEKIALSVTRIFA